MRNSSTAYQELQETYRQIKDQRRRGGTGFPEGRLAYALLRWYCKEGTFSPFILYCARSRTG
ncbi:1597_t:CDS:2 [Rhizophagus irregularis]|nr:1597_t:CDS:2 [Rhizophagus irregularis]